MINDKQLKINSVAAVNAAMKNYRGESYVEPPKTTVCIDDYRRLSRFQSDQGVIALVHATNLSGGSMGDMDLYKLVRTYLWDEKARAAINDVVKRSEKKNYALRT